MTDRNEPSARQSAVTFFVALIAAGTWGGYIGTIVDTPEEKVYGVIGAITGVIWILAVAASYLGITDEVLHEIRMSRIRKQVAREREARRVLREESGDDTR